MMHSGARHLESMQTLLSAAGTAGNLVSDADLAALAIDEDATLVSFDTDFARFDGLRWGPPPA
jgi:predicted nucleic acid-binding protein